jgi:hypothetical protein
MHPLTAQLRMTQLLEHHAERELVLAEDLTLNRKCCWSRPTGGNSSIGTERTLAWARVYAECVAQQGSAHAQVSAASEATLAGLLTYFDDRGPNIVFIEPVGHTLEAMQGEVGDDAPRALTWLAAIGGALERLHQHGVAHGRVSMGSIVVSGTTVHLVRPRPGAESIAGDERAFRLLTKRLLESSQAISARQQLLEPIPEGASLRESVARISLAQERTSSAGALPTPQPGATTKPDAVPKRRASVLAIVQTRRLQNTLLIAALVVIGILLLVGRSGPTAPDAIPSATASTENTRAPAATKSTHANPAAHASAIKTARPFPPALATAAQTSDAAGGNVDGSLQ